MTDPAELVATGPVTDPAKLVKTGDKAEPAELVTMDAMTNPAELMTTSVPLELVMTTSPLEFVETTWPCELVMEAVTRAPEFEATAPLERDPVVLGHWVTMRFLGVAPVGNVDLKPASTKLEARTKNLAAPPLNDG